MMRGRRGGDVLYLPAFKTPPWRLFDNAHLRRFPHPASLRCTCMYASFLGISGALHLGIGEQPPKVRLSDSLPGVILVSNLLLPFLATRSLRSLDPTSTPRSARGFAVPSPHRHASGDLSDALLSCPSGKIQSAGLSSSGSGAGSTWTTTSTTSGPCTRIRLFTSPAIS